MQVTIFGITKYYSFMISFSYWIDWVILFFQRNKSSNYNEIWTKANS